MSAPDDDALRAILAGLRHGDVNITADRCTGDIRAVEAFCDLVRAAPALAEEVLRLRAIIEGRPTPPTTAEVEAHMAAGGAWLASIGARVQILAGRIEPSSHTDFTRWVALDRECRPCAWPTPTPDAPRYVTTSQPGAAIEVQERVLSPEEIAALDFGRKPFGGGL